MFRVPLPARAVGSIRASLRDSKTFSASSSDSATCSEAAEAAPHRAQRGEDLPFELEISFDDMMKGLAADIQVPRMEACGRCYGERRRARGRSDAMPCLPWQGRDALPAGFLTVRRTCSQCNGRGRSSGGPADECKGEGYSVRKGSSRSTFPRVWIPARGLRLTGEGQPGANGGPSGDLYVLLKVKEHPIFDRENDDLHCTVPVNVAQAALGTEMDILTFDGLQTVKVPEGTQKGAKSS